MIELYQLKFPNRKSYIGISRSAVGRYKGHASAAEKNSDVLLSRAWRKYGAPKLKILAVVEKVDALATEQRAVKAFGAMTPGGYNMTPGGEFSPMRVPEIVAKLIGRKRMSFKQLTFYITKGV